MLANELKAFDQFLDEQTWQITTLRFYRYLVNRLAEWMTANEIKSFSNLTIRDVKEFLLAAVWGNSMARKLNSVLLQFMVRQFGEDHALAKWRVRREVAPPQRTLNQDKAERLIASFQPGISSCYGNYDRRFRLCDISHPLGIRNLAIIWLLLDSGYRSSELCHLELKHLDLANRQVTGLVKFGKWRTASFSQTTADALATWLSVRAQYARTKSGDRIFIGVMNGYQGVPFTDGGLRAMLRDLGNVSGIGALSPHDLRRTFATLAIRAGASIQAVKEAGGWKNSEMVMHYTRAITAQEILPHLPGNTLQKVAQREVKAQVEA